MPKPENFEVASFNRTVITDGFNRAVATELAQHLDPFGEEKTLIFCFYVETGRALRAHISRTLESEIVTMGALALGRDVGPDRHRLRGRRSAGRGQELAAPVRGPDRDDAGWASGERLEDRHR